MDGMLFLNAFVQKMAIGSNRFNTETAPILYIVRSPSNRHKAIYS